MCFRKIQFVKLSLSFLVLLFSLIHFFKKTYKETQCLQTFIICLNNLPLTTKPFTVFKGRNGKQFLNPFQFPPLQFSMLKVIRAEFYFFFFFSSMHIFHLPFTSNMFHDGLNFQEAKKLSISAVFPSMGAVEAPFLPTF